MKKIILIGSILFSANLFANTTNCSEPSLNYKIGETVYTRDSYSGSYKPATIVAQKCNGNFVIRVDSSSNDETQRYSSNMSESDFYKINACTTYTENGVEICNNEIALNISTHREFIVLAINNLEQSILYEQDNEIVSANISDVISLKEFYQFESGEK